MNVDPSERVFGNGRLKMVTGQHVEVFREAAQPGERRRYTKRFLTTSDGDYAEWTEREWKILARLIGHGARCIPDVVQYDRGFSGTKLVVTHDAGANVDQWATLVPVERDGRVCAHVFEDCAHWWALAHHCLVALDEIHSLHLVHLDVKGDNVCIPIGPAGFDPARPGMRLFPEFRKLALIDFAFALVSGETLTTPLPIGWQKDYDYQSPRLLQALESGRAGNLAPTECLDWRCDMYGLAAMLARYLPGELPIDGPCPAYGWTEERYDAARALIQRIRNAHDRELTERRPHAELITETSAQVCMVDLVQSLERGWTLARVPRSAPLPALPPTPVTQLAPSIRLVIPPREVGAPSASRSPVHVAAEPPRGAGPLVWAACAFLLAGVVGSMIVFGSAMDEHVQRIADAGRNIASAMRDRLDLEGRPSAAEERRSAAPDVVASNPDSTSASEDAAAQVASVGPVLPAAPVSEPKATSPNPPESLAAQIERYRAMPVEKSARQANAALARAAKGPIVGKPANVSTLRKRQPPVPSAPIARFNSSTKTVWARTRPPATRSSVARMSLPKASQPVVAEVPSAPAPAAIQAPAVLAVAPVAADSTVRPSSIDVPPSIAPSPPKTPPPAIVAPARMAPIIEASPEIVTRAVPPPATGHREAAPSVTVEAPRRNLPPTDVTRNDALADARWALANVVPQTSAFVGAHVASVLSVAAGARHAALERRIIEAANAAPTIAGISSREVAPDDARRLHEQSRQAHRVRKHVPEALDLELKAFGANPFDAEIAGSLASLYLTVVPAQPERARQLALHAISVRKPQSSDDWMTLAIASALVARTVDARNALYAALALSRNADRTCRLAAAALEIHGQRLQAWVDALVERLESQGRAVDCDDPRGRVADLRY